MNTERLLCDACGAPLEIPDGVSFVTCQHCETALSVKRDESVHYTQILEDIYEKTQKLGERIDAISGWHEVEALDRKWEMDRQQLLKPGETVATSFGTNSAIIFGMLIGCVSVLAGFFIAEPLIFGLLLTVLICGRAIYRGNRAIRFRNDENRYLMERQQLVDSIRGAY
ncbi:hypothetical protein [Lacunimicrobium album]